jgi:hypothetical protein
LIEGRRAAAHAVTGEPVAEIATDGIAVLDGLEDEDLEVGDGGQRVGHNAQLYHQT